MEIKVTLTDEEYNSLSEIISSRFGKHLVRRIVRRPMLDEVNEETSVEDFITFLIKGIISDGFPGKRPMRKEILDEQK
jgi:hypothetical protein